MYSGGLIRVKDLFPDYNSTPSSPKHSKYKLVSKLKSMLKPSDKTSKPTFRSYISTPEPSDERGYIRDKSAIQSIPLLLESSQESDYTDNFYKILKEEQNSSKNRRNIRSMDMACAINPNYCKEFY